MTMGIRRETADLDRLLDRIAAGEEPEATGDLAPFLHPAQAARAALVRSVPMDVAREHLSTLREDRARDVIALPVARRRGLRLAAAFVAAAMLLVVGAGSAVAASSDAQPGDPLYGVKRAVERVSLALHRDPVGRAALHLQFAEIRLHEIQLMVSNSEDPVDLVDDLNAELNGAEEDALHAVALGLDSDALLAHVQEMIAKHIAVLNGVLSHAPDQAKDALQNAIDQAQNAKDKVQHGRTQTNINKSKGTSRKPSSPPGKPGDAPSQGRN
jgi:uncharacterized protein DUF5667